MRARYPDREGVVTRDGVGVGYEVYERDAPTILLLPSWSVSQARLWKGQIPFLARHWRVVAFDGRGNGRSDRPQGPAAYADAEFVADAVAVLDATDTRQAVVCGLSRGGKWAALLAARHPERVLGAALIAPGLGFTPHPHIRLRHFQQELTEATGWEKFNASWWRRNWQDFLEFFYGCVFPTPHSTKAIEDGVAWGLETTPEVIIDTMAPRFGSPDALAAEVASIRCPVLVVHAEHDAVNPHEWGARAAALCGGTLITLPGGDHAPNCRYPATMNRLLDDFARRAAGRPARDRTVADRPSLDRPSLDRPDGDDDAGRAPARRSRRPRRALYLSSPIGLGHVRRDLAIAAELRALAPDLTIDWLAQDPVTRVLDAAGERIHPASAHLASESQHLTLESGPHSLPIFDAFRRMDEILTANFMVFQEVVERDRYDLVIGDEAWEVDHYWHEHPELKRAPFAWLTDFVGFLPLPEGGGREERLTADYNQEMLEHVARHPHVRDRAIFIGDPEDVVPARFGPGLPEIARWTAAHFSFSGYVRGFAPPGPDEIARTRAALGWRPDERVCVVTVGGSGVGQHLLERVIAAFPEARARVPGLRLLVVAGPRIDRAALQAPPGVELRAFVPDLLRHLSVCDVALVQGGLATCMELATNGRPFVYVPLERHFEQQRHVPHRLERHGAGVRLSYARTTPEEIADALAAALAAPPPARPVGDDGARRAAARIAELLPG